MCFLPRAGWPRGVLGIAASEFLERGGQFPVCPESSLVSLWRWMCNRALKWGDSMCNLERQVARWCSALSRQC